MAKKNIVFHEKIHGEETLIYFIEDENTGRRKYFVLEAVPETSTAAGGPARIVRINGERVPLDQVHIPDPVSQELCRLTKRIEDLEKKVLENENL